MLEMMSTRLIGAVQYTISDTEKDVVDAIYVSSGSMAMKEGTVCRGRAEGDTSNGFPGDYVIRYYDVNGALAGTYDWHIDQVGDAYRIKWFARADDTRLPGNPGDLLYEGIGFANSDRSIVVAYWFTEELSNRLTQKLAQPA